MKHVYSAQLKSSKNLRLFGLATVLLGAVGLTKVAIAQTPPQISIPPQQLQDIQRAVEPPINQPTNNLLMSPYNTPQLSPDPSRRLEQTPTGKPGDQGQPILKIDPPGKFQQERHYDGQL